MNNKHVVDDRYKELARVLYDAYEQAAGGKGKERHADGENFENQKICVINRWLSQSPVAGPLFQAVKKAVESSRLEYGAAIGELYGAINYISAAILLLEEYQDTAVLDAIDEEEFNREAATIKMIEDKALKHVEEHGLKLPCGSPVRDVSYELAVFEGPLCEECFYMKLAPDEMPCKKCIDKPFKPHFTHSVRVYTRPSPTE